MATSADAFYVDQLPAASVGALYQYGMSSAVFVGTARGDLIVVSGQRVSDVAGRIIFAPYASTSCVDCAEVMVTALNSSSSIVSAVAAAHTHITRATTDADRNAPLVINAVANTTTLIPFDLTAAVTTAVILSLPDPA